MAIIKKKKSTKRTALLGQWLRYQDPYIEVPGLIMELVMELNSAHSNWGLWQQNKELNIYVCILMHLNEIQKKGLNNPIGV